MIVLLSLLTVAAAASEPAPPPAQAEAEAPLVIRKQGRRVYPRRPYDDLSIERRCTVEVEVDERGRPASITPVDCPDELVEHTRKRVRRDRWEKPVPPGARTRVEVVYVPPVDVFELPAPDHWRRRAGEACELHVAVATDGAARVKRHTEGCEVEVADWGPTDPRTLRGKVPEVCPVTFLVVDGDVRHLDLFRCGLHLWGPVREGLARWSWATTERAVPWTVLVQVDGPQGGDGVGDPGEAAPLPGASGG